MMQLPRPQRPQVENRTAKTVLEWADTVFYIFCLLLTAAAAVAMFVHTWDFIGPIAIPV
jgi:hypothetical protein